MTREFSPSRLDVNGFAADAATLAGADPVTTYPRLAAELADPASAAQVVWEAQGEERAGASGAAVPWLHLTADAVVPLVCQRCLTPVELPLSVQRWFRFVADEATAEAEDDESDEDLLVVARDFDLRGLVEDELLMEIPLTPVHETCPVEVRLSASDADFEAGEGGKPNPFAVLGALRTRKPE
ncbi:MAG: DUF177 domain-containing protein [Variovorax sp.]|nr:MAG: DUF177 domain-containing protein [Variovorax sp.]